MSDLKLPNNPYASPTFATDVTPVNLQTQPNASQNRRFLNFIVDNIVLQVLSNGIGFVVGMVVGAAMIADHGSITKEDEMQMQIIGFLLGLTIAVSYYFLMELLFQRTLGKFATGTIVIAEDGGRPSVGQILGRSFARFIPFEAFSFLGKDTRGWHDSLSGTRVVRVQ